MKLKYHKKSSRSSKKRHLVWDFSILLVLTLGATGFFIYSSNFGGLKLAKNSSKTPNATKQLSGETSLAEALKNQDKKNNLSDDPTKPSPETTNNSLIQRPQAASANTTPVRSAPSAPPAGNPVDPCNKSLKSTYTQQRDSAILAENTSYNSDLDQITNAIQDLQQNNPLYWTTPEYIQLVANKSLLTTNHNTKLAQIESTYQTNVVSAGCSL